MGPRQAQLFLLRQEIAGSPIEQQEPVPCGQTLRGEEEGKLSPAQIRDLIFLIFKVKEAFLTVLEQKGFLEIKKGVTSTYP